MFTPSRELELRNSVCSLHVLLCASARPIVLDVCERSTCTSDQAFRVSAHASFMYTLYWSKLCAPASYRSQARTVHEHTTCAQVVQALRASSRPRPRVLDLRGQSVCNALYCAPTPRKLKLCLDLMRRRLHPPAQPGSATQWQTRSTRRALPSKVAAAWRSESTRRRLVALASILCAFWGRTHAAQPKKSRSSELLSSVSLNLVYYGFLWTLIGARTCSTRGYRGCSKYKKKS